MIVVDTITKLPNTTAVYALYGGRSRNLYVAYVGIADKLRRRIEQHLVTHDSSVAVGTSATGINPTYVTRVSWWENDKFTDRAVLQVAEVVACHVLNPTLRSRAADPKAADALLNDPKFREKIEAIFNGDPTGILSLPTLEDAIERINRLEQIVSSLEDRIVKIDSA